MEAKMNANNEKAEASISVSMKSNQDLVARLEARIEIDREKDQEDLKGMMEETNAKADGKQEEMLAKMRENIKSSQAEIRSTVCAIRSELDETAACNEATEIEPDPRMMQSIEEHQEIP
jgi:esterase/lipase